jgi:hypothetical protein
MIKLATCPESDECLTPRYAVEPIIPFLKAKGFKNIWCPFDTKDSFYYKLLFKNFYKNMGLDGCVWASHKDDGTIFGNFFYMPKQFLDFIQLDCFVSNPPFSLKDKVLKKLFNLGKPFAMLMPITALGGKKRQEMFKKYGIEVLFLGERTGFYTKNDLTQIKEKNHFECCYICHNLLPEKIMYANMKKIQEPYDVEI